MNSECLSCGKLIDSEDWAEHTRKCKGWSSVNSTNNTRDLPDPVSGCLCDYCKGTTDCPKCKVKSVQLDRKSRYWKCTQCNKYFHVDVDHIRHRMNELPAEAEPLQPGIGLNKKVENKSTFEPAKPRKTTTEPINKAPRYVTRSLSNNSIQPQVNLNQKKKKSILVLMAAIVLVCTAGVCVYSFSNSGTKADIPMVATPAVISHETITPAPTPTITTPRSEYTNFYNELAGYSVEYPSSWKVTNANGMYTVIEDTGDTKTFIDVMRQQGNYQEVVANRSVSPEMNLKVKDGVTESIIYSVFTQSIGAKVRYNYICDFSPLVVFIECDYQSESDTDKYFDKVNTYVLHMITSYRQ
jgi:hypothetical protein